MNLSGLVEYYRIRKECKKCEKELIFDMRFLDEQISVLADKIYNENKKHFDTIKDFVTDTGFMATELYDLGGHTPCLVNLAESLYENQKFPLFITKLKTSYQKAPKTMKKLEKCCNIEGLDFHSYKFINSVIRLYNMIVNNPPRVMILYIHQHDILAAAVMHLLKKNTDIKLVFFDHATHFPNIGMTMCDLVLELLPLTEKITNDKRKLTNCEIVGLQSKKADEVKYYSAEELKNKRAALGVREDNLLTVSGGSSYKYFDKKGSEHYQMIKELLHEIPNLKHLAITNLSAEQEKIIDNIFKNSPEERKRLIFHNLTPEYDILFQSGDLFIDSFPVSSAMTQIDLMGMKVPTVVKINTENPSWTFHEYMPENYPYMYKTAEEMKKGIIGLLKDKTKREELAKSNYEFWMTHYESNVVKEKYLRITEELIRKTSETK